MTQQITLDIIAISLQPQKIRIGYERNADSKSLHKFFKVQFKFL